MAAKKTTNTAKDFANRLAELSRLIKSNEAQLAETPQLSAQANKLVEARKKLVRNYFQTYSQMISSVGLTTVVNGVPQRVKTVPDSVTQAISLLGDDATASSAAAVFAGRIPVDRMTGTRDTTEFWNVPVTQDDFTNISRRQVMAPTAPTGPTGPTTPTGPTAPTGPTIGGRPTTGGGAGGENKGRVPRGPKLSDQQVIAKFREMFPGQAWLTEVDSTKYPGLQKVIRNAVEGKMWSSSQGQARFDAEFRASDFYRELASTDKVRQIKSLVGDLGFDSKPFNAFLKDAMNFGWEGDTLKQEVYKEVFRKDGTTGTFANPTAVERTRKSAPYLQLQNVGRAYFNTVSDTTIQNVLTGAMTTEDVGRQQREFAKAKYGHLSSLIDQGLTLEDIAQPFKKQAAQMLEKSEDDIDMSSADFETAFSFGEEGKKRLMSTGEWNRALRTNKVFGWDKTDGAKREAREIAASIVQAFGKVI